MSSVVQADSTLEFIVRKVRRLTASASEASLSTADIQEYINNFYNNDFPYAIKIDQQRSVYTFFTIPNVDRYPVDVNNNQGLRAPVYFEGVQGNFFKNRDQLYNLYPRYPQQYQPVAGDGITTHFTFSLFGNAVSPFPQPNGGILSTQVVIGGMDVNGNPIRIVDDGGAVVGSDGIGSNTTAGKLLYIQTNNVGNNVYIDTNNVQQPAIPPLSPLPIPSPGSTSQYCGTVNYITTAFDVTFPVAPADGTMINVWAVQYVVGRPYCLLFWNNELTVRPVPDNVYKIEIESFLTPTQFMANNQNPILNQWAQYIAYGAACEILRDRQDMEGLDNCQEGFMRQEALVLERQSIEEINQPTIQMFNSTAQSVGFGAGLGPY